jgi:zinc transporter ZupT
MSAKQAVFYNLLSSVLCFLGMCLGIVLGDSETASQWIFAGAAGMFLYIALVDMVSLNVHFTFSYESFVLKSHFSKKKHNFDS